MILVIGSRSKIGSALIGDLAARGEQVRALMRSGEAAELPQGVETVRGDLGDPASLDAALAGVQKMFLLCGPNEQEVELNKNAVDAAKRAGVELLVRSSILGAGGAGLHSKSTFVRDHSECDAYLRESGVNHAIVRPNMFMQNIPESTIPSIGPDGAFYGNAGDAKISMVDTRDVAAVAAALLTGSASGNGAVDVTGGEALSYHDVAAKLSTRLGRTVTYVPVPDDAVQQALAGMGMAAWMVSSLVELFADYRDSGTGGYAAQVTEAVQELAGRAPRTLDQLLSEGGA